MVDVEILAFLNEGTRTGHLATTRADGRPHIKPIWFVAEGPASAPRLIFNTGAESVAGRNLARDPRVSLSVDDQVAPYASVIVSGTAELITDLEQVRAGATVIGGRYMGADRAAEFGARNGVPGELLVRVTPVAVRGLRDIAG